MDSFAACYFAALKSDAAEVALLTSTAKKSPLGIFTWFSLPDGTTAATASPTLAPSTGAAAGAPPSLLRMPTSPLHAIPLPFQSADAVCMLAFSTLMVRQMLFQIHSLVVSHGMVFD